MKRKIIVLTFMTGIAVMSCSKVQDNASLKQSFEKSVADVNSAVSMISVSKGYEMLSMAGDPGKSGITYKDSITLKMIAGIYDFQPLPMIRNNIFFPYRLFKKTGTSDKLIVNLPEKLVFRPKYLVANNMADSVLKNNFTITASDYHFYYNRWNNFDYKLAADFTLDKNPMGSLEMETITNLSRKVLNSAGYKFTEGYAINTEWAAGDTTTSSFALTKDDNVLLKESNEFIRTSNHQGERKYSLTIGNVEIRRMSGVDSIQVYLNGVLQKKAAALITDSTSATGTICDKRDILLTFDDGTTAKISEMISPALTALRSLVGSLHSMYFAKNIADYIAMSIYYNTHS